ncbi:MAG: hypothetical protein OJF49_004761 [Ktedonobacterales bacterium]|jgi:thioredoxin 1|nr:MAG: hypothetical protein OJF49_004761 [Ktedonobacterales bacterium]
MNATVNRLAIIAVVALSTWLMIAVARRLVAHRREQVLATAPPLALEHFSAATGPHHEPRDPAPIRILAFSSDDCAQCHRLQDPALARVVAARGDRVSVIRVDAPSTPDLTSRYRVLTLPTTVVLDVTGHAHAVNYGFASTQHLLDQVDDVLALVSLNETQDARFETPHRLESGRIPSSAR